MAENRSAVVARIVGRPLATSGDPMIEDIAAASEEDWQLVLRCIATNYKA